MAAAMAAAGDGWKAAATTVIVMQHSAAVTIRRRAAIAMATDRNGDCAMASAIPAAMTVGCDWQRHRQRRHTHAARRHTSALWGDEARFSPVRVREAQRGHEGGAS